MEKRKRKIKQAAILAGGKGERLRPLTDNCPKPMVTVSGRPFAEHLVHLLKQNGIEEIIFLSGYLHEKISDYFGDGSRFGMRIRYSVSPLVDETGTRVRKASPLLNDRFLLLYGDNYWPLELKRLEQFHEEQGGLVTITIYRNLDDRGEYGKKNNIIVGPEQRLTHYGELSEAGDKKGLDIGFFVVEKEALKHMPTGNPSFQGDFIPELAKRRLVTAHQTDHPYHTITNLDFLKRTEQFLAPKKVVFLDRDGVINEKMPPHQYVTRWSEFAFRPKAIEGLKLLTDAGYQLYIVTNQRGIQRGLMTEADLGDIHARMTAEMERQGVRLSGIYYCPHGDEDSCHCRKPKAGMLYRAAWDYHLDLTKAFYIGDDERDKAAGETAGCKTIILKGDQALLDAARDIIRSTP